jgi:hypothetical protein
MMKLKSKKTLALIGCLLLTVLAVTSTALALASIWGPASGPTTASNPTVLPASLSAVTWIDTTTSNLGPNPTNIKIGDTLQLSTTITPTTTNPQTVNIYYTHLVNPTSTTPIGNNPATQLVLAGSTTSTSTVTINWIVPESGPYYFIPVIQAPA